jgi:hypothetical protein
VSESEVKEKLSEIIEDEKCKQTLKKAANTFEYLPPNDTRTLPVDRENKSNEVQ